MPKSRKSSFNVEEVFGETTQVMQLESQITQLTQEIEELRSSSGDSVEMKSKLEELQALAAATRGSVSEIEIEKIRPNPSQPRQTFSHDSLLALALSLQEDGQQQPIIVIDNEDGSYLIFDGERRWRACQLIQKSTLAAVTIARPDKELHRQVLVANLHRENLNGLDVAEALIKELKSVTSLETKQITTTLNTGLTRLKRNGQYDLLVGLITQPLAVQRAKLEELDLNSTEERQIIATLLSLRLNPASINMMTFKILEFPEDLKQAIREGLPTTHAREVARLKVPALETEAEAIAMRSQCVTEIMTRHLSVTQAKTLVSRLLPKKQKEEPIVIANARKINAEGLSEVERQALLEVLQEKIKELEAPEK
jgi:ParB family chromosome partitioning protein